MTAVKTNAKTKTEQVKTPVANNCPPNNDLTKPLMVILGAVGVVIILIYVYPFAAHLFGKQKEVFTSVEDLGQRHLDLEQKVLALQTKLEEKPMSPESIEKRMDVIEATLNKLVAGSDTAKPGDVQSADSLKKRIDLVEEKLIARQQQIANIPDTIGLFEKLRDSMLYAKPFENELTEAKALFDPKDQDMQMRLQSLQAIAKSGVATVDELQVEFKTVAKELRRLSIPADLPWYSKLVRRLQNLVVVRKNGEALQGTSSVEERIAGIQGLLENGNLEEAIVQAELLPDYDSEAYKDWKIMAAKRQMVTQSLPIMEAHVLAYLLTGDVAVENKKGE